MFKRTLEIFEKSLEWDFPDVDAIINNRAGGLAEPVRTVGKIEETVFVSCHCCGAPRPMVVVVGQARAVRSFQKRL